MKLYHFPAAPNAAKVLAYVREKGITAVELVTVNFFKQEQRSREHLARSPRGTVPVLELEDGAYITESLPIIEYLEEQFPEPVMIGEDAAGRAHVRSVERYIELNVLMRIVRLVHATNSPIGLPPDAALAARERSMLPDALAVVDEQLSSGPFVVGDKVSIADCTLLAALNFARFGKVELDDELENINRWFAMFALRHL